MSDFNNSTLEKIYYYIHKATLGTENNADKLNNPSLFLPLEEDNGENGYDYLDSSTKDSNVDEDVGLGYDLDNSYEWNITEKYDESKDGTLSRKSCTRSSVDALL